MNHATIAEYLALGDTKTKAKSVGNIIAKLRKKGYIETVTTHNYNGKNGGSSTTIIVNEMFFEAQLYAAFNSIEELHPNTPQVTPVLELEPIKMQLETATPSTSPSAESLPVKTESKFESDEDFIAFMQAESDEPRAIPDLPCLAKSDNIFNEIRDEDREELERLAEVSDSIDNLETFKYFLQELLNRRLMTSKKEKLQWIIDNQNSYDLEKMKGAFDALILKSAA